ncbi:MAG: prepilin-type N-terminal cleavage/methylation domain-containing protein [Candidatus Margulisbacteria bacterium]|nr:prepilin-type N-terminal cleavage/methylation domain-containing protein [Candidatus Margulisiibacteriota bacterium]
MRNSRGFTMFELIIVMVVIVILSAITFVSISFYADARLNSVADKVANDIRYARDLAASTADWYGVEFGADPANTYHVFWDAATGESDVEDPARFGDRLNVDLSDKFSSSISSVDIDGGNKVVFDAYGKPYDDRGGTALADEGSIVLQSGGNTVTIYITPETGRVRVE